MDVVGIESPCIDFLSNIEQLPEHNKSTRLIEYSWQGGGKVSTALVTLARLGARCGIIGAVGSDIYGRFCKKDFENHGIDTTYLRVDDGCDTSLSLVLSEKKTRGRNIIFHPGTTAPVTPGELDKNYIQSAKFLHLARVTDAEIKAVKWAKESGTLVAFDADYFAQSTQDLIPEIDIFIASEFYYDAIFHDNRYEDNCRQIQKMGPEIVVFTLGGKGCVGVDRNGYFSEPTFDVPVVDTVGAGDVFHGAFLFALLKGWEAKKAARFSNAVSSIKCTRIGGRAAIPDLKTVEEFIRSGVIDYSEIDKRVNYYRGGLENVLYK